MFYARKRSVRLEAETLVGCSTFQTDGQSDFICPALDSLHLTLGIFLKQIPDIKINIWIGQYDVLDLLKKHDSS